MGKRSFRQVPSHISEKIALLPDNTFRVGTAFAIDKDRPPASLAALGVIISAGGVAFDSHVIPPPTQGRFSKWNLTGRQVIRRDLGKISKDFGWYAPNFGGVANGSHWVSRVREVYLRDTIHGLQLPLLLSVSDEATTEFVLAAVVDRIFDRSETGFESDLIFALSLLQENLGSVGIVPTAKTLDEWVAEQYIAWEILPVSDTAKTLKQIETRIQGSHSQGPASLQRERFRALLDLKPVETLIGTSGFSRYVGFKFRDDLVAFENASYGNALYLMYEKWADLSKRSKLELFSNQTEGYDRITHTKGWEQRLGARLRSRGHRPQA